MPNNKSKTVQNPLWRFRTPNGKAFGDSAMGEWEIDASPWNISIGTSRHGTLSPKTQSEWIQGVNNFGRTNLSIQAHQWYINEGDEPNYAISDLVSRLLSDDYLKSWRYFSTTLHSQEGNAPAPTDYLSLEYIHNNIHNFTGGTGGSDGVGHMSDPGIASFDPIFFLHHCNVDRQLAMWQTLNPDKWFDNLDEGDGTSSTPLNPFHKDTNATVYTSDDCRDWTKLNYQYDVLENTPRWIRAEVHSNRGNVTQDHITGHVRRSVNLHFNKTRQAVLSSSELAGKSNDYLVNVVYDRYALGGKSYSIHFFTGPVPDSLPDDCTFQDLRSYVGSIYTFSSPLELSGRGACQSCIEQRKAGVLSRAQIVLTAKLIGQANNPDIQDINSLHPEEVEAYLVKHLQWKVVEAITGRVVDMDEVPSTKVYVMRGEAEHFEDPQQASRYGGYGHMWAPTEGKAGGAVEGDRGRHMEL